MYIWISQCIEIVHLSTPRKILSLLHANCSNVFKGPTPMKDRLTSQYAKLCVRPFLTEKIYHSSELFIFVYKPNELTVVSVLS